MYNDKSKRILWNKLLKPINKNLLNKELIKVEGKIKINFLLKDANLEKKFLIFKNYFYLIKLEKKNEILNYYMDLTDKMLAYKYNSKKKLYEIILYNSFKHFKFTIKNLSKFIKLIKIIKKFTIQNNFANNFIFLENIQINNFSITSNFKKKINNKFYIVKRFCKKYLFSNSYEKLYFNEINNILKLDHLNVINLKERYEDDNYFYLVFKKFGDNIKNFLRENLINNSQIKTIISQVINGWKYIHSLNLIHRDIKPENIWIKVKNEKIKVKIIDFGLSCNYFEITDNVNLGTVGYIAPEYINFENKNNFLNFKSDVYSLGCTIYYLFKKENIFRGKKIEDLLILNKQSFINKDQYKFKTINKDYINIIFQCLKKNPIDRICLDQLENLINI